MGGAASTVGRGLTAAATGGLSEFARRDPFGAQVGRLNPIYNVGRKFLPDQLTGASGEYDPSQFVPGPFSLDPYQLAADKQSITDLGTFQGQAQTALGQSQYDQANSFIAGDQNSRETARQRLAEALTRQKEAVFQQGMAGTLEDLNARHLANGSGVGQEFARQQGNIATNIGNEIGTLGARDYELASQQKAAALQGLFGAQTQGLATAQGGGTNALSRGLSLEDFITQANVAKTIGAQAAPQVGNGKGQTGALLGGIGAVAPPLIGAARGFSKGGPAGAAAATAVPALAGDFLPIG